MVVCRGWGDKDSVSRNIVDGYSPDHYIRKMWKFPSATYRQHAINNGLQTDQKNCVF